MPSFNVVVIVIFFAYVYRNKLLFALCHHLTLNCYLVLFSTRNISLSFVLFCFVIFQHHCRNCGGIFCNSCSDYTMPLPSSAKPVRVCDACYTTLLQRYQRWQQTAMNVLRGCLDVKASTRLEKRLEKNFTTYFRLGKILIFLVQARLMLVWNS